MNLDVHGRTNCFFKNAHPAASPLVMRRRSLLPVDKVPPGKADSCSNQTVRPEPLLGRALLIPVEFNESDHPSTQTVAMTLGASKCTD